MICVRVLREGRVVREVVFTSLPVTIGRGPSSDLVLPDGSVSRAHARIERTEDGGLRLVDLDSRNGLHVGGRPARELRLDERVRCLVGLVQIELEPVSEQPTLEIPARDWRRFDRRPTLLRQLGYLLVGVTGLLVGGVIEPSFWSPEDETRWVDLLGMGLVAVVLLSVAAGVLFVALKALGRQLRLAATLRTVSLLTWLTPLANLVLLAAYYPLSPFGLGLFQTGVRITTVVVVVTTLVSIRRRPRPASFVLTWAAATLLFVGAGTVLLALEARQTGEPQVDLKVQVPLGDYAGRADSFEGYLGDVRAAVRRAEQAAADVRRERNGD